MNLKLRRLTANKINDQIKVLARVFVHFCKVLLPIVDDLICTNALQE